MLTKLTTKTLIGARSRDALMTDNATLDWLAQVIKRVSVDSAQLSAVAKRSYYHTNNFYKVTLSELDLGLEGKGMLRLHLFEDPRKVPTTYVQNPHDHGWNFKSMILAGALRDVRFQESSTGAPHQRFALDLRNQTTTYSSLENKGEAVKLKKLDTRIFRSGHVYYMSHDEVHTSEPCMAGTMTVVFQGPLQSKDQNFIYQPAGGVFETSKHHRHLTTDEVSQILATALHHIQRLRLRSKL